MVHKFSGSFEIIETGVPVITGCLYIPIDKKLWYGQNLVLILLLLITTMVVSKMNVNLFCLN